MTSNNTHNLFPLHVITPEGDYMEFWCRFMDIMDDDFTAKYRKPDRNFRDKLFEQHVSHVLETYGATTDWTRDSDPIWFPDQEQMTTFVLTYS
jgi:hypothetical protein